MDNINYKVRVSCMTFNHSKYIEDCLNGFCMQQTDFPFVCTIIDDASTDGEQDIINNYLEAHFNLSDARSAYKKETEHAFITFARHKNNNNCYFAVIFLKENHYSKSKSKEPYLAEWNDDITYIAMCEGDDYWTNPLKLQNEVFFMDTHPDVGLCYTDYNLFDEESQQFFQGQFSNGRDSIYDSFEDFLIRRGYIAPMTWVYRKEVWNTLKSNLPKSLTDGTYAYALEFFANSKVAYLPDITATYRSHTNSASRPSTLQGVFRYNKGVYDTQLYYAKRYLGNQDIICPLLKMAEIHNLLPIAIELNMNDYIAECQSFAKTQHYDLSIYFDYDKIKNDYQKVLQSKAYRLGKKLLKPLKAIFGK